MKLRRGMGKGMGTGYKNLIPTDHPIHQMSGKGMKQPQRINMDMIRRDAQDLVDRKAMLDAQFLLNKIPKDEYLAKLKHLRGEKEHFVKKITKRVGGKKSVIPNIKSLSDDQLFDTFFNTRQYETEKYEALLKEMDRRKEMHRPANEAIRSRMNLEAPDRKGMEKSGSESYLGNLDVREIKKRIREELKEGYAHSYDIVPVEDRDSRNYYHIVFYKKPSKYNFFWKRGGENILKSSSNRTAQQVLNGFRKEKLKPAFPYAVSSVEQNMFLASIREAIDIAKPKDKKLLLAKANKMIEMTPYTNWSGD